MTGTDGPVEEPATHDAADAASTPTLAGDATLAGGSTPPRVDPREDLEPDETGPRYEDLSLLGRGGMGEVSLCLDRRIGRQVARKVIRAGRGSRSDARIRFLREARVQAQLEHPSIVPVYDVGKDDEGQTFFTMKRIRGQALDRIIDGLRRGESFEGISARRLLTAFSQACLAIDFAHERGVLHRDLKPANIMLGDYGEVYVLDWGLAKLESAPELERSETATPTGSETADGEVLGTPGYIAPEQLSGDAKRSSDVYALGCILFEILTLQRLHEGKTAQALLVAAIDGADARPSRRTPDRDVAPELEEICVQATATDPQDRYASARELHDAVERYLDGDRDLALRRRRAAQHAEQAQAYSRQVVGGDDDARAPAMREVGRTLGLDPGNRDALAVLANLLQTPPAQVPSQAAEELEQLQLEQQQQAARNGGFGYLSGLFYLPLIGMLGILNWVPLIAFAGLLVAAALVGFMAARAKKLFLWLDLVAMCAGTAAMLCLYPLYGPYVLLPTILLGQAVAASLAGDARVRIGGLIICGIGLLVPVGLDLAAVVGPVTTFETSALIVHPHVASFPPLATPLVLAISSLGVIVTCSFIVSRVRNLWTAAEQRNRIQAWHLRQMIAAP